jgi:hypothetical protein
MKKKIEIEEVVVGRGRRPHGHLPLVDDLPYPPRKSARR